MAKLTGNNGIGGVRTPALGPGYRISMWRGIPRIVATSQKKKQLSKRQLETMTEFRQLANAAKAATPQDIEAAMRMSKGSQYLWRDLIFMANAGRLFHFMLPDGRKVFSMAARTNISDVLEAISQTPGAILIRAENWWDVIMPGPPGTVLTMPDEGAIPRWLGGGADGGGGVMFSGAPQGQHNANNAFKGMAFQAGANIQIEALQLFQNENNPSDYRGQVWGWTGSTLGPLLAQTPVISWSAPSWQRPVAVLNQPVIVNKDDWFAISWNRIDNNGTTPLRIVGNADWYDGIPIVSLPVSFEAATITPTPGMSLSLSANRWATYAVARILKF